MFFYPKSVGQILLGSQCSLKYLIFCFNEHNNSALEWHKVLYFFNIFFKRYIFGSTISYIFFPIFEKMDKKY